MHIQIFFAKTRPSPPAVSGAALENIFFCSDALSKKVFYEGDIRGLPGDIHRAQPPMVFIAVLSATKNNI